MALEKALISAGINILGSMVGLVAGKVYDSLTDKLKDGDIANEKVREIIVRDLNDIKSKLDCLSLKDLDASYSFLKEGVELLNLALDKLNKDQKASEGPADEASQSTRVMNNTASDILNASLSLPQAIQRLKISSDKRFVSAQDCFKASRERATDAFNNKSLSIKDRIMACKLRVAARILESGLEDPEAAVATCVLSLKELHGLPAIQEMFSVFLKGGLKSKYRKAERLENLMSVLSINHALVGFASKNISKYLNLFKSWPVINLTDRTFHPILNEDQIFTKAPSNAKKELVFQDARETFIKAFEELSQRIERVVIDSRIHHEWAHFAVNSRGDILLIRGDKITVICKTGESKDVILRDRTCHETNNGLAVDSNDNIYVVSWRWQRDENGSSKKREYVLYVIDENYNIKHVSVLDFFDSSTWYDVCTAVDKNRNIIMIQEYDNQVYVCDDTGQLKSKFKRGGHRVRSLSISNNNDVMIVSDDHSAVHVYTTEGNLKSTIKVPEGHTAWGVTFHHGICKIIVLTYVEEQRSWFLLYFSETCELENSVFFRKREGNWRAVDMASHPSGPVAVGCRDSMTFI